MASIWELSICCLAPIRACSASRWRSDCSCATSAFCGAANFHLTLLLEPRELRIARDLEAFACRVEVLGLNLHPRFLLDIVARLAAQLDLLGELGEALRVERVVCVEVIDRRLIEAGQRYRFELKAVHREIGGRDLLYLLDELGALLVQLVHRHPGSHGAERIDEFALDQLLQMLGLHRTQAEGLGSRRDAFTIWADADIEFRLHVDPQPIERDQRVRVLALHGKAHGVEIDRHRLVENRQHHRAAVDHDLLTTEASADEADLLSRAAIEARDDQPKDDQRRKDDARIDGQVHEWHFSLHQRESAGRSSRRGRSASPSIRPMKIFPSRRTRRTVSPSLTVCSSSLGSIMT